MNTGSVRVDGADLYFESQGSGPTLLMIPGGTCDAGVYSFVAPMLADRLTVLSYDRRGNSRSHLHDAPEKLRMDQQSADAIAVLDHNAVESAIVFGSSGGAVVALDMAERYPERIQGLIPHEPPVPTILPNGAEYLAPYDELDRVIADEGWLAAHHRFLELNGMQIPDPPDPDTPPPLLELATRLRSNWEFFTVFEMRSFIDYVPDLKKIAGNRVPIVPAGGVETRDWYYSRTGRVIAEHLGADYVEFPGGHVGYLEDPQGFVATMRELLPRFTRSGE